MGGGRDGRERREGRRDYYASKSAPGHPDYTTVKAIILKVMAISRLRQEASKVGHLQ